MDLALYLFSDDEKMEHALNESFDMSTISKAHPSRFRLDVSPVVTPKDGPSPKTFFCSACMDYYSEHEMHMFEKCSHGLCKLYCASKLLSPHCSECGVLLDNRTGK